MAGGVLEILSELDGGVGEREPAYANFATRAARARSDSSSVVVSRFGILETTVVEIAVSAVVVVVVDDVARVSPDESSMTGASSLDSSRVALFG